jgi:tRNA (guanosine-2'-O-)-methyltransferase
MSSERYQKVFQMLDRRQPDLTVFMDDVHKAHNLGAIVRTCDAVGVGEIHAWSTLRRLAVPHLVSGGSKPWVHFKRHRTAQDGVDALKARGFTLAAAHLSDRAVPFTEYDFTQPTALVLGSEKHGLSGEVLSQCDVELVVPMQGMVQSLNVSVAAALILFEAQRQKQIAGQYNSRRISDELHEKLLFEGCQAKMARYCRRYNKPYPPIDEDGDIVGGFELSRPLDE